MSNAIHSSDENVPPLENPIPEVIPHPREVPRIWCPVSFNARWKGVASSNQIPSRRRMEKGIISWYFSAMIILSLSTFLSQKQFRDFGEEWQEGEREKRKKEEEKYTKIISRGCGCSNDVGYDYRSKIFSTKPLGGTRYHGEPKAKTKTKTKTRPQNYCGFGWISLRRRIGHLGRLDLQHCMMAIAFDGRFAVALIRNPKFVLDVATGTGTLCTLWPLFSRKTRRNMYNTRTKRSSNNYTAIRNDSDTIQSQADRKGINCKTHMYRSHDHNLKLSTGILLANPK